MTFISVLLRDLERSSPGSGETAKQVLSMLGSISPKSALFVGDEIATPQLISERFGCRLVSAFTDEIRVQQGSEAGLDASAVQQFELPGEDGSYDLIWYNGIVDFDGCEQRLEQLRAKLAMGGTLVYRTVSWLTEPSPDTKMFCQRRFGRILPLDKVLVLAKEMGWHVQDFYIADFRRGEIRRDTQGRQQRVAGNERTPEGARDFRGALRGIQLCILHTERLMEWL